jgi:tRNA threonylcarbamoyladenosine biosynthesis protein TsaE
MDGPQDFLRVPPEISLGRIGESLGRTASPGALILLSGAMGTGKTSLAAGVARGMGILSRIASPTFLYLQEYPSSAGGAGPGLLHADWDRVSPGAEDLEEALLAGASRRMTVVEWGEKLPSSLVVCFPLRLRVGLSIPGDGLGRCLSLLWESDPLRGEEWSTVRDAFWGNLAKEEPSLNRVDSPCDSP